MNRILLILLLLAAIMVPANVRAEVYQPLSPWNIHYAESACDLKRIFKGASGEIQIQISQAFDLRGASFYLVTKPTTKRRYWEADVVFTIDETGAELKKNAYFLRNRDGNLLIWQIYGFDIAFLEDLPDEITLRLNSAKNSEVALRLTGMKSVNEALEQCQRNLYEAFGVDYGQVELLSRLPKPDHSPGRWVTAYDYPTEALRKDLEGTTRFMLLVDREGRTENCVILQSSGHQSLDDQACKLLEKRARFIPALDEKGERVTSTWISAVRWQVPR